MSQSPPPPYQGYAVPPTPPLGKNVGRAALVVGIIAFVIGLIPFLGLIVGVVAVVLGYGAIKTINAGRGTGRSSAITGIVLGGIAALTGVVVALVTVVGLAGGDDAPEAAPAVVATPSEPASPSEAAPSVEPEVAEEEVPAPAPTTDPAPEPAPEVAAAVIGTPVVSGDLGFTVTGIDCSTTTIGSEVFGETAQGKFCIVDLSVTNNGDSANYFTDSQTTLLNADDQEYSASSASIYLEDGNFLEQINPGNTLAGKVVFDVPADMTPTAITLRDGLFDEGVDVVLG